MAINRLAYEMPVVITYSLRNIVLKRSQFHASHFGEKIAANSVKSDNFCQSPPDSVAKQGFQ
jgi:hypothetical protein